MEKGDKQAYSYHVVKVGFYFGKKKQENYKYLSLLKYCCVSIYDSGWQHAFRGIIGIWIILFIH